MGFHIGDGCCGDSGIGFHGSSGHVISGGCHGGGVGSENGSGHGYGSGLCWDGSGNGSIFVGDNVDG